MVELNSQEHYVALAGSLDREAETRLEQEPGVESKAKKLTRSDSVNHDEDDDYDDYDHQQQETEEPAEVFCRG